MKLKAINEKTKNNLEFLDTIDFLPFIKKHHEVCALMTEVADTYNENSSCNMPDFLEGDVFSYVDNFDFINYLKNRYGFKVQKVMTYYIEEK